jgi:hypothetical protein
VLLADKKSEDENSTFHEEIERKTQRKVQAIQKDEYMLYDDEDEDEE